MKSFVLSKSPKIENKNVSWIFPVNFEWEGLKIYCGEVDLPDISFDLNDDDNQKNVLVRVKAFSINHRDASMFYHAYEDLGNKDVYPIGSEFCAEVLQVGPEVDSINVGDLVIGDNHYHDDGLVEQLGVPVNFSSQELLILPADKVFLKPDSMTLDVAASFSVASQTSYSILEKLQLKKGDNLLITGASSNTSVTLLNAAVGKRINVTMLSRNLQHSLQFYELDAEEVWCLPEQNFPLIQNEVVLKKVQEIKGFHGIADPFVDFYFPKVAPLIKFGGNYVFSGIANQLLKEEENLDQLSKENLLAWSEMIAKKVNVLGACLGERRHLQEAVRDWEKGLFKGVPFEGVYSAGQELAFIEKAFGLTLRFGKSVWKY